MKTTHLKRLAALLLALLLALPVALAEETLSPLELPFEEPVVEEQGEVELPGEIELPGESEAPDGETARPETDSGAEGGPEADLDIEADPDAGVLAAGGGAPKLSVASLTLGVKETATLTLAGGASVQTVPGTLTSSAPKIATVSAEGLVKGRRAGTATITLTVNGAQTSCAVTVRKAPKKITLSARKRTLGVGEGVSLNPTIPAGTASAIRLTSSNPAVASVDASGRVVGVGVGTATITAATFNRKKAKCRITVKAAPTYVTASVGAVSLWVGRTLEVEPILSPGSAGAVTLTTSNSGVVSVSGMTIRAVARGSATLTLRTYNGLSAEFPVTVTKAPVYRALVIGEGTFPGSGLANLPGKQDVALMKKMLSRVKGPSGSAWRVRTATDLTAAQIHSLIQETFSGAEAGDVSLFYISSHGDQDLDIGGRHSSYAGCLMVYPDDRYTQWYDRYSLTLGRLAGWLNEVPGQVVVLIDSCGSGAAIYGAKGVSAPALSPEDFEAAGLTEAAAFSPEAFDQAVVDAFRSIDKGVLAAGQGAFVLENKFYVLTSCAYHETGWSLKNRYSYFTKWLTDGVRTRGRMPADRNRDKQTTVLELYNYMKNRASKKVFRYEGVKYRQHVQVYPANSAFELFHR